MMPYPAIIRSCLIVVDVVNCTCPIFLDLRKQCKPSQRRTSAVVWMMRAQWKEEAIPKYLQQHATENVSVSRLIAQ